MVDIPAFPIGVISEITGLSVRQIRYYDKTGLVNPARTGGNQRRFSRPDLEKLLEIRRLLDQGFTLQDVRDRFSRKRDRRDHSDARMCFKTGLRSVHPVRDQGELMRLLTKRRGE